MLVAYVSDERYIAIADALLEFEQKGVAVATARPLTHHLKGHSKCTI